MADNKKGINPAAVGVVGAVIGAAAASAAIALSDKENRKKVGKVLKEVQTEGGKTVAQIKKAAEQIKDQATATLDQKKANPKKNSSPASSKATKSKES